MTSKRGEGGEEKSAALGRSGHRRLRGSVCSVFVFILQAIIVERANLNPCLDVTSRDGELMKKLSCLIVFVALIFVGVPAAHAGGPLLLQKPTLSKTHIAFAYAGDLWLVA